MANRPLSPHLQIWKWGPHMLVSILHRVTGGAITVAGLALLTWWLVALSSGGAAYETFQFAGQAGQVVRCRFQLLSDGLVGRSWIDEVAFKVQ